MEQPILNMTLEEIARKVNKNCKNLTCFVPEMDRLEIPGSGQSPVSGADFQLGASDQDYLKVESGEIDGGDHWRNCAKYHWSVINLIGSAK